MFDKTNTFCISQSSNSLWFVPSILQDPFVHYFNIVERSRRQSHIQVWKSMIVRNLSCALVYEKDTNCTPFLFENAHSGAFSSAKSNGSMRIFNAQRCKISFLHDFAKEDDRMELVKYPGSNNQQWNFIRLSGNNAYLISNVGAKWLLDTYDGKFVSLERMLFDLENVGYETI